MSRPVQRTRFRGCSAAARPARRPKMMQTLSIRSLGKQMHRGTAVQCLQHIPDHSADHHASGRCRFVIKTTDETGSKVFINVCGAAEVDAVGDWADGQVRCAKMRRQRHVLWRQVAQMRCFFHILSPATRAHA